MKKQNRRLQTRRDASWIARRSRPRLPAYISTRSRHRPLTLFEDRRTWHPEGAYRPARSFSRHSHRLEAPSVKRSMDRTFSRPFSLTSPSAPALRVAFETPDRVLVCVRRKRRREAVFASGKAGLRGQRKPRRSFYSSISC